MVLRPGPVHPPASPSPTLRAHPHRRSAGRAASRLSARPLDALAKAFCRRRWAKWLGAGRAQARTRPHDPSLAEKSAAPPRSIWDEPLAAPCLNGAARPAGRATRRNRESWARVSPALRAPQHAGAQETNGPLGQKAVGFRGPRVGRPCRSTRRGRTECLEAPDLPVDLPQCKKRWMTDARFGRGRRRQHRVTVPRRTSTGSDCRASRRAARVVVRGQGTLDSKFCAGWSSSTSSQRSRVWTGPTGNAPRPAGRADPRSHIRRGRNGRRGRSGRQVSR